MRVSNLIGFDQRLKKRKVHNTFINCFFENIKKGFIYDNKKNYKDFLSTKQFSKIIELLIKKDSSGIFNVSIGKKILLNQLVNWLNYFNKSI